MIPASIAPPRVLALVYAILLALALVPIFAVTTLPLLDYPTHLARMHVLLEYDRTPALQRFFEIHWAVLPNLSMEMVVLPLARILPLEVAGKVYVAACHVVLVVGVAAAHRALHGRWSSLPLAAFVLLYNDTFLMGFMNYMLALGVAFLLFALWIALRERPLALRLVVLGLGATFLFLCQLPGLGIYALIVGGYEVSRAWTERGARGLVVWRDWIALGGQFVVPAILFLGFSPTSDAASESGTPALLDRWYLFGKLELLFDVFRNYDIVVDRWSAVVLGGLVALGLLTRRLVPHRLGVLPFALVAIAFVLVPKKLFSAFFVDDRLALTVMLLFLVVVDWRGLGVAWRTAALGIVAAVLVVRLAVLVDTWRGYDRHYAELRAAFELLPEGTRLTALMAFCCDGWGRRRPPIYHHVSYATILRNAYYPGFFAFPSQQPVLISAPYRENHRRITERLQIPAGNFRGGPSRLAADPYVPERLDGFDHVFVYDGHLFGTPPPPRLVPIATGSRFGLYRIERTP